MSPITTHVLDTARGVPARGVGVRLALRDGAGTFHTLATGVTNADGRVVDLLPEGELVRGVYRLSFATGAYLSASGQAAFFPEVDIVFEVSDPVRHYHVPLLLNPFGYSTYRGS